MTEFKRTKVELVLAIKEQEHKVEMVALEYKETYGKTPKQQSDLNFIIAIMVCLTFLVINVIVKVNS